MQRKSKFWLIILVGILLLSTKSGYRLTPEGAANTIYSSVNREIHLESKYETEVGQVFVYKIEEDSYLTITPRKKGILWSINTHEGITVRNINSKEESVRIIGWGTIPNGQKLVTVMIVKVMDDRISYIEAGEANERVRKKVIKGEDIGFTWDKLLFDYQVSPVALSKDGEKLYEYGFPDGADLSNYREMRWLKIR